MIPVCSGTQILDHSYGFQSHTRQYLGEDIDEIFRYLLLCNTLLLLCDNKSTFSLVGRISDRQSDLPLTFAVVIISQFIASPTADLSLATE